MKEIRWGILSTAAIGVQKVIPAMQQCNNGVVTALASRDACRAASVAADLGIPKHYGSYDELLADPDIDAIYNPLPNHLHVPLTLQAIAAGKHVLCEKPIALSSQEAQALLDASENHPQVKVMEAFMYRFHPQWQQAKRWVDDGAIGNLRTVQTFFSYFNDDPDNIRNQAGIGGGGLMDIGCYPISQSRFLYQREPNRAFGLVELDPRFNTDRLASAILDFGGATATFTCSTQLNPLQRAHLVGDQGRIDIEIPVNAPPDRPSRVWLQTGSEQHEQLFAVCDQYTLQGEAFAQAIINETPVPTPLTDALANMRVIEAINASHQNGAWADVVSN